MQHLLKLLTSTMFLPRIDSSQAGWSHVESYVCSWAVIQLLLKMLSSVHNDKLVDPFSPCTYLLYKL